MPQEYTATDTRTGLTVTVHGEFPPDKDDRIRIAATSNLFTKLMATVLSTENSTERRALFRSLELALEWADAAARQDMQEMNAILQRFLAELGITQEQMQEMIRRFQEGQGPEEFPPPPLN